jgi:TonB family protein
MFITKRALLVAIAVVCQATPPGVDRTVSEGLMRTFARVLIVPKYPRQAITENITGVLVVSAEVDTRGHLTKTEVLEAPSVSIRQAAVDAVSRWVFQPMTDVAGRPVSYGGVIIYYFVIVKDEPKVLSPAEAREQRVTLHNDWDKIK